MSTETANVDDFVQELTQHQVEIFYFIRSLTGDVHAAMDIRQAVNMVLWKKREQFRPGTSFRNWAFQIAQFEVKIHLRKLRRENKLVFDERLLDVFADEYPAVASELPERLQALTRCLQKVTPKDHQLLRHRYWESGTLDELARQTARSVGTLKARLHQLRASLRRCIESQLHPGSR
jgi:RNA polymerase sigma-70 factor (ECF subfamily)